MREKVQITVWGRTFAEIRRAEYDRNRYRQALETVLHADTLGEAQDAAHGALVKKAETEEGAV